MGIQVYPVPRGKGPPCLCRWPVLMKRIHNLLTLRGSFWPSALHLTPHSRGGLVGLGHAETPLFLYGYFPLVCRLLMEEEGTFVISGCLWEPLFPIQILKDKNKRQRFRRRNQQEMAWSLGTGSGEPQCVGVHPFPWVRHTGDLCPSHPK